MKKYEAITTDQVFQLICNSSVCIMNYQTSLIPSTAMAEILKTSTYRVKKCLKELKEKGFVLSGCESVYSSWHEQYFIVRGYYLTEKARETETYKEAEKKEIELINKCFGSDEMKGGAE
ncbi:hypothetical protein [Anaerotignum sp. MB30-C6]|uniref:hypothetical protein n=1 Tax=Anaerotignum sp. MB30-C6 TaxID=3070814 RepID=UPI0027DCC14D|nr:hypothetical protein [Anaerotignum sp. MB30-C6]WMI81826.1 hypothetical protein RBQ60_03615 [Anaerotignum sp. MB30-C6]